MIMWQEWFLNDKAILWIKEIKGLICKIFTTETIVKPKRKCSKILFEILHPYLKLSVAYFFDNSIFSNSIGGYYLN